MTLACFHILGTRPSSSDFLKMILMGRARASAVSVNRMVGMSSGPAAFPLFSLVKSFHISSVLKSMLVRGLLNVNCGALGSSPSGSSVKTLWKKSLRTWAFSLSVLAIVPSSLFRSSMPDLVLVFALTYDQKDLGFLFACSTTVFSSLIFALRHSLAALFLALAYSW